MSILLPAWLRLGGSNGSSSAITASCKAKNPSPSSSSSSITIVDKDEIIINQLSDAKEEKVQWIVQTVVETHSKLLELPHLRPDDAINQLLGNLVSVCSEIHDQEIVNKVLSSAGVQAVLPSLRQICAQSESCLELHWAEHILQEQSPEEVLDRLRSFPYYDNYEDLTRLELCSILSATHTAPRKIAFIGSGPLPLTSLCLLRSLKNDAWVKSMTRSHEQEEQQPIVLNVDYDESAISASLKLSLALGEAGKGMEFICAEASSASKDLTEFDVVYMAALVGISQTEKEGIMLEVVNRMRKGALLVVRSSWGLRTCLYPEVDLATENLLKRLEPCVVVHPYNQVVNSVIVARVRG
ncbi:putative nicotianamine synthase [Podospora fimiseda]|uniref:Nicotianamine synthase n=1 Tax=Podospora fimiseda TaxID=252190 RepID=A0AAN7GZL4_9PEZI|nr:putative nicotianamine synthase [Podospora fimiseda]